MRQLILSVGLLTALAASSAAIGQDAPRPAGPLEPWADPEMPVTRGLVFWLDAARLNGARKAHGLPEAHDGTRIEIWHDGSGHGRHFTQRRERARPTYLEGALRFDGEATFLERPGPKEPFREITLFVVAAPLSNHGGFRAFAATHRDGQDDYTSGINVDLGGGYTGRFDGLNVEGPGFGGMTNLMDVGTDFGVVRRLTVTSRPGRNGTRLDVDGRPARARDRAPGTLIADRILVGARHFGFPPSDAGFLDGDILQVLLYDRVLDASERRRVEDYLTSRLGGNGPVVRPAKAGSGKPLVAVRNPPPVQMLVPGFSARELPVKLTNVNNVKYRADGKLVALAYGGDLFLLSDTDGDGLEDRVETFWENKGRLVAPIGMALTPPGDSRGEGVFVASKGKVSLIVDRDHDNRADDEIIVASGWKPLAHGVDTLGVAVDRDGSVYFGLGTTDFTNPYRLDATGRASYDLNDEHGTIQRVSPDFRRREIIATGIRFPVALAFNRLGDLFATDQEGATWLPNGNPFDELLHIQPGRHYGFPPRHPKHLPAVIDEPSVFDYAPQHQSTCGLNFNEPVNGGPPFGPGQWAGNALVAGYSRGKLFRTELARTPAGYVARNHPIAVLNRLTADACVTPRGGVVVATHSGLPDWGSGPRGEGRLYKIVQDDRDAPQPVFACARRPQEVRIAFDRPLDPARLRDLSRSVSIEYGAAVSPGDRFESLRPGYEVVGRQMAAPRFELPVLSTQFSADRRTLLLATATHPMSASYAITLPDLGRPGAGHTRPHSLPQVAAVDVGYDLTGVEAAWKPESGKGEWSGWLPHPDLSVARAFTVGSADHDALWAAIATPGRLTLRMRLDFWQMLRPAVQPGSRIDYTLPDEKVTLILASSAPITVNTPGGTATSVPEADGRHRARVVIRPTAGEPIPVEIALATGPHTALEIAWTTREDARPRALPPRRILLPWASLDARPRGLEARDVPELKGGDWARGRALFFGEQARCSGCHKIRGRGGEIGPDLSNLVHRDYASVLRDVRTPGAAINPDYIAHSIAMTDGRVLQGTLRTDGDRLVVGQTDGRQTIVDRSEVETTTPSSASIMPEGLDTALGPDRMRDLLTFLLIDPLTPAKPDRDDAPPPRRRPKLDAVLKGSVPPTNPRPLRIVLSDGPKDHGPGEHDYPLWRRRWADLLGTDVTVRVETSDGWPTTDRLDHADILVIYSNNPGWDEARAKQLDRFLARGGGVVLIHYAVDGHQAVGALADRIGLAWQGGRSKFRHGPLDVDLAGSRHPIARGFSRLRLVDESYWDLVGDPSKVDVIGSGVEDGRPRPLFWTKEAGKGRVFVSIPGHFTWTFDDPLFRLLILRGMAWTANEPVDRFNELATLGARMAE